MIEEVVGKKAIYNYMDMQPGDVPATEANVDDLVRMLFKLIQPSM